MSQKKVDAYKQEKANRKQIMKREKRMLFIEKLIGVVVCIALIGWFGFSIYNKAVTTEVTNTVVNTDINTEALDAYLETLS